MVYIIIVSFPDYRAIVWERDYSYMYVCVNAG